MSAGHREVVLTGINAGTYAGDGRADGAPALAALATAGLPGLVRRILAETDVERIRLSSIEPQHITDDLLEVWTGSRRPLPAPLPRPVAVGRRHDPAAHGPPLRRRAVPPIWWSG